MGDLAVKNVIIIGEEEYKNKVLTLKNMETGDQSTLGLDELIEKIKQS